MQVAMVVGELLAGQSVGPREKISTVFSAPRPSFRVLVRFKLYAYVHAIRLRDHFITNFESQRLSIRR